jgi:hypothetical protein
MEELLKKKMEIAKRAGELEKEIFNLTHLAECIKKNVDRMETLYVKIQGDRIGNNGVELSSHTIDPGGTELHNALLLFLKSQIDKRTVELDELIKVMV